MNKFIFSMGACALALAGLTSCQQDSILNEEPATGNETVADMEFNVKLPQEMRTRADNDVFAFGDGSQITTLRYAIYLYQPTVPDAEMWSTTSNKWTKMITSDDPTAPVAVKNGNTFTLKTKMPVNYKVIAFFWADHSGRNDVYSLDFTNHTVTIDFQKQYEGMFQDYGDAFTGTYVRNSMATETSFDITLTRPFVQLNVLTDEDENNMKTLFDNHIAPAYGGFQTEANGNKAENLNVWNFFNNTYSASSLIPTQYVLPDISNKTAVFKNRNMRYIGMSYIFPPKDEYFALTGKSKKFWLYFNSNSGFMVSRKSFTWPNISANSRLILYNRGAGEDPSNPDPGSVFEEDIDFNIDYQPIFDDTQSIQV